MRPFAHNFLAVGVFFIVLCSSFFGAARRAKADWPKSVTLLNLNVKWNTPNNAFGLINASGYANLHLSNIKLEKANSISPYADYNVLYVGKVKSNFFDYKVTGTDLVTYDKDGHPIYGPYMYSETGKDATVLVTIRTYESKDRNGVVTGKFRKIGVNIPTVGQRIGGTTSAVYNYTNNRYVDSIEIPLNNALLNILDYSNDSQYDDKYIIKSSATCDGKKEAGNAVGQIAFDDDFHVENMPVIMRNIGVGTSNMAWYTASQYWEKWLKGSPSVYKSPLVKYPFDWSAKNVLLPLSWIESDAASTDIYKLKSSRVFDSEKSFQDPKSKSFYASTNGIKSIIQNLQRDYNIYQAKDGSVFPLSKVPLANGMTVTEKVFGDYSQKSLVVSMGPKDTFPGAAVNIDPLTVMLNGFNFYMVPIGTAKVKNGTIFIDIQKIAYFVVDGFEFTDWEKKGDLQFPSQSGTSTYYGYWALPKSIWPVYNGNYEIRNSTFRDYRRHKGLGMDYLVVSDIKIEDAKYRALPLTFPQFLVPFV